MARQLPRNLHTWLEGYAKHFAHHLTSDVLGQRYQGKRHLLFSFCDHWEPLWGNADDACGDARVAAWVEGYGRLVRDYRDSTGRHPRHSFFFPGEQYRPRWLDGLAQLCRLGLGEVEVHLHHDGDTEATLRQSLIETTHNLAQHGHLVPDAAADSGFRFGFIHGNWCLANARADGRWCGVDSELQLLHDLGCYADFTFPSAPDECQPNLVNQIYWPIGDLRKRRSYEHGERAKVGHTKDDRLLMVQGPIALTTKAELGLGTGAMTRLDGLLDLARGKRSLSALKPRLESAAVTAVDPGTLHRVRTWVSQNIHVGGRPEWVFVKVHTHGCPEREAASLLGDGGRALHDALTRHFNDGEHWDLHYVSAREMYNVAWAAMAGESGNPSEYYDFKLAPPPVAQ
jgi:hypothetical protein